MMFCFNLLWRMYSIRILFLFMCEFDRNDMLILCNWYLN